jgi:TRAP-type C4-dicarboxylate transport system permease large subunit
VAVAADAGIAKVFLCGVVGGVVVKLGFEVNVYVNRNQIIGLHDFPFSFMNLP